MQPGRPLVFTSGFQLLITFRSLVSFRRTLTMHTNGHPNQSFLQQLLPPHLPAPSLWPAHPLMYQPSVNNWTSTLCRALPETHLPPPGWGASSEPISSLALWDLSWVSYHRLVFRGWVGVHNVYEGSTLVGGSEGSKIRLRKGPDSNASPTELQSRQQGVAQDFGVSCIW